VSGLFILLIFVTLFFLGLVLVTCAVVLVLQFYSFILFHYLIEDIVHCIFVDHDAMRDMVMGKTNG
jgi:hypothetical protein